MPELPPSVWAAALVTIYLAVLFLSGRRVYNALPPIRESGDRKDLPDCMVVIPARNEEMQIGRAVRSLPHDTVIVVDDHSTDRTAQEARDAGAGVLPAPELPRKGLGRANACAFGAAALTSRWVLFTDADTWFEAGFLHSAVAYAEAHGLSLLSIYLDPESRGIAEQTLVPYARALTFAGFGMTRDRRGLFRGQCLLVQREAYIFIGGYNAVVTQIADDIKLIMAAERHRMKIGIARAPGLGHVRLYQGYRGIQSGLRRFAFRFMAVKPGIGVTILMTGFGATLWLPILVWLLNDRQSLAAGLFAWVPTLVLAAWYPGRIKAVMAPIAAYWILPALAGSFVAAFFGRSVEWKGRKVRAVS